MPDDPKIIDMDPILRLWMYCNWLEDIKEKIELTKNHAYLIGSFTNPEAVSKLLEDNDNAVSISDTEFEESSQMVLDDSIKFNVSSNNAEVIKTDNINNKVRKRKRKILKG